MGKRSLEPHYVYLIRGQGFIHKHQTAYKIGVSYHPEKRFREMSGNHSYRPMEILHLIHCTNRKTAYKLEDVLHQRFADWWLVHEWFDLWHIQRVWIKTIESGDLYLSQRDTDKWAFRDKLIATNPIAAGISDVVSTGNLTGDSYKFDDSEEDEDDWK